MEIKYKKYSAQLAAVSCQVIQGRSDIRDALEELARHIPAGYISGPPFCIFNFITSVTQGEDVTLGYPVLDVFEGEGFEFVQLPEVEALACLHEGDETELAVTLRALFAYAREYAIISDEFYREIYLGDTALHAPGIELQFVIHNWNARLEANVERVLGDKFRANIMQGSDDLEIQSGGQVRFDWVVGMLERLDRLADANQKWDILSGCAHVFPKGQITKLTTVYQESLAITRDPLKAVDAVIAFMDADPGWSEGGERHGKTIHVSKKPRDPRAYANARNDLEKRQAYCYCPLLRNRLDQGMPVDFCHCGSGWFRQQWEGATGRPVRIETVKSVLRGDERCAFVIHLPEDLGKIQ